MKILLIFLLFFAFLIADDLEIKGDIGLEYKKTFYSIPVPNITSKSLNGQLELQKQFQDYIAFIKVEVLEDKDDESRSYTKLNEAYIKYEGEDYEIKVGKSIKFWGALELHNLTDIYNEKNILNDPYDKDKKLGETSISYTKYFENEDEVSLIIGDDDYIKYSGSSDDVVSRDFGYILTNSDNKFLTYHTAVIDYTMIKAEFSYLFKDDNYYELGIGVEHTLYGIFMKKDLGIICEYYKSDNEFINYNNDLFIGFRVSFNDIQSSDIITGVIQDIDSTKNSYSFEYNTRIFDKFKTKINYMKNDTFYIVGFNIGYYF